MRQNTGAARGARIAVRLSREDRVRIDEVVKARGYTSPSAFIRAAIQNELNGRPELTEAEERIVGGFDRMSRDNVRIVRASRRSLLCSILLSKQFLRACRSHRSTPSPRPSRSSQDRYHQLIKAAGQACPAMPVAAMKDLVGMARTDDERKIRLRPPKPRRPRTSALAWSSGFKLLMHYARSSRKARNRGTSGGKGRSTRPYLQRCAVRVTYLNNKTRGQWKAHGRYLARESATHENPVEGVGFGREDQKIDIAARLEDWQKAGDERLWKLIISPEFGDQADLRRLTGDLMERMEKDLGTDLEWVAVEHHNTEHPTCSRRGPRPQNRWHRLAHEPRVHPARDSERRRAPMHSPNWVSDGARCGGGGTARDLGVQIYIARPPDHAGSVESERGFRPRVFRGCSESY
jgi:Arc/MetJ-type ribon-helix-helix transcriptional regulator